MKGKPAKRTKEGQQNLGSLDLKHEVSKTELKKILQAVDKNTTPPEVVVVEDGVQDPSKIVPRTPEDSFRKMKEEVAAEFAKQTKEAKAILNAKKLKEKRQEDKENKKEYSVMKGSDEKGARKEIVEKSTRNEAVIEVKAVEENVIVEKKDNPEGCRGAEDGQFGWRAGQRASGSPWKAGAALNFI